MIRKALTKQEVIDAIERKDGRKIPLVMHKWWGDGLEERYGEALDKMAEEYPEDIFTGWYIEPGCEDSTTQNPEYRFGHHSDYSGQETHSIGRTVVLLPDWDELDEFIAHFPTPNEPGIFDCVQLQMPGANGRYKLGCWWGLFHEKLWGIRGMENLMCDYYDNMDGLKLIGRNLLEFHKVIVDRYAELGFDGIFTSDDLGHQTGPMMSPAVFEELYFPLYKELIAHVHKKGMHMFLHSCGDNTLLMPYLIKAGLDVFHPVQKGCMDMSATAEAYDGKITFLVGMDVQNTLPCGTVSDIKNEILSIFRTFNKGKGGLLLAAGNGIMGDTPIENIQVMLDTMSRVDVLS